MKLSDVFVDLQIEKPVLLKNNTDPQNPEYFLLQARFRENWYTGLSLIKTPQNGYRSQGGVFYKGDEDVWELV